MSTANITKLYITETAVNIEKDRIAIMNFHSLATHDS